MQDEVVICHKEKLVGDIADRMFLQNMKNLFNCMICIVYVISCVTVGMQSLSMVYENPTVIGSIDRDSPNNHNVCLYVMLAGQKY